MSDIDTYIPVSAEQTWSNSVALGTTAFQFETLNGTNFRTVTVNDMARGPLNEALRAPLKNRGP